MPKKPKDDAPRTTGRRARLSPTARAQAQRDAFSRRVARAVAHLQRYGTPGKPNIDTTEISFGLLHHHYTRNPVRGVNRVTGMPYSR